MTKKRTKLLMCFKQLKRVVPSNRIAHMCQVKNTKISLINLLNKQTNKQMNEQVIKYQDRQPQKVQFVINYKLTKNLYQINKNKFYIELHNENIFFL
ncbi:hypothetical protein TTHERM_000633249 (macronuclear) [Tetrahymena thermophila SB210]|uniref:Uncharacterized protein n=1 Tax=Tetrahymena thermophila (strain SB210) TaxID=312017 RepID=W7XL94_TETTS|nr:hypothetical protein TTHERM_000633249 [Tetrahymena thermophila SB210]EWS75894.1 hypothetical protein TTHERM_000633249 [Tetrahymena thermophila SB210]|eukprot:XP_012651565.1 hypothetical protein TTHERM_000633249 [Tetrahymena thermophila SB210]